MNHLEATQEITAIIPEIKNEFYSRAWRRWIIFTKKEISH